MGVPPRSARTLARGSGGSLRTVLSEHPASRSLGRIELGHYIFDAVPATGGAYQFPAAGSLRDQLKEQARGIGLEGEIEIAKPGFSGWLAAGGG